MEDNFANTAVFCKECGRQLNPGDKFCRECGSTQTQEVNIEPVNVEKKMRLRASELLLRLNLPVGYVPLMSDGMPARGMMSPDEMNNPNYRPPVFVPTVKDVSIKHEEPVVIHSTEIDVFNLRCSYFAPDFNNKEMMKWYPTGDYCFHMIRTSKGARCRIEKHCYNDNREEEFDADAFALTRLDRLLKERDVAQLDGYSVHSPGAANHMDLLVQYTSGERIAATGIPPQNNNHYNEEWFIDFFRNMSGAFGKNIFTDSFKERERAEREAEFAKWNKAGDSAGGNALGSVAAMQKNTVAVQSTDTVPTDFWECVACGQHNTGPFCINCGQVRPKT